MSASRIGPPLSDKVRLIVPATTGHLGLARATASGLAARLDFTYDRLTDLHIAIDEACGRLLAASDPPPARLDLIFDVSPDALGVRVQGDAPLKPGAQFLNPWSRLILESIAGDITVEEDADSVAVSFAVRRGAPP